MASPGGHSARGIVRVSGDGTRALLQPHVHPAASGRRAYAARLGLDRLELPVVVIAFTGPRSYTGQDAAELQVPGNPVLLDRMVSALVASGRDRGLDVRRAEAGEFTARAYLNGRISLTEAEGVAATIAARSDAELAAARLLSSNRLGIAARGWSDDLAGALALVEAGIDFTDEDDVVAIGPTALHERLAALRAAVDEQLRRAVGLEQLSAIPWVVLAGPPNAGKSTLFNALLGHERAVVSDVAGTTRDVLAEPLALETDHGPAEVMLADVAGAERAPNRIGGQVGGQVGEQVGDQMQSAAAAARARAELIVWCTPADAGTPAPCPTLAADHLVVVTKADLAPDRAGMDARAVSAVTGRGLDDLRAALAARLADRAVSLAADALALQSRHEDALRGARQSLDETMAHVAGDLGRRHISDPELVAASARAALDRLGRLAGAVTPDDVLGRIFASFCVGK